MKLSSINGICINITFVLLSLLVVFVQPKLVTSLSYIDVSPVSIVTYILKLFVEQNDGNKFGSLIVTWQNSGSVIEKSSSLSLP